MEYHFSDARASDGASLLGLVGANFLGCRVYLIWQARSISLPGGNGS